MGAIIFQEGADTLGHHIVCKVVICNSLSIQIICWNIKQHPAMHKDFESYIQYPECGITVHRLGRLKLPSFKYFSTDISEKGVTLIGGSCPKFSNRLEMGKGGAWLTLSSTSKCKLMLLLRLCYPKISI